MNKNTKKRRELPITLKKKKAPIVKEERPTARLHPRSSAILKPYFQGGVS